MAKIDFRRPKNTKLESPIKLDPELKTADSLEKEANATGYLMSELVPQIQQGWKPTVAQRDYKTRWYRCYNDSTNHKHHSLMDVNELNAIMPCANLVSWMRNEDFKDWFYNNREFENRLERLFALSLDVAESLLLDTDPKTASARVNLIKVIATLSNKEPKKSNEVTYIDKQVNSFNKEELENYIKKNLPKVTEVDTLQLEDKSKE